MGHKATEIAAKNPKTSSLPSNKEQKMLNQFVAANGIRSGPRLLLKADTCSQIVCVLRGDYDPCISLQQDSQHTENRKTQCKRSDYLSYF